LEDFIKQLNNEEMKQHVSAEAKNTLNAGVNALIYAWSIGIKRHNLSKPGAPGLASLCMNEGELWEDPHENVPNYVFSRTKVHIDKVLQKRKKTKIKAFAIVANRSQYTIRKEAESQIITYITSFA
jgi:hypothetical protein